jgi:tRNA A-37 threonylcarbamoyl transferase component Bud32
MTRSRSNSTPDMDDPDDLFSSIKSKIAQRDKARGGESITVDLIPVAEDGAADAPAQAAEPAAPQLRVGAVLSGRYVIESQLASGGMGTVYKALDRSRSEHEETDALIAVKVLHEKMRTRSEVLAKLRREFYCAQALAHRSIVKVYELDLNEIPFFSMELIDGESLPSVMQRFHPIPLPSRYVWSVIREVGEGLVHAHQRCVVHGDIKPQNIMVTNAGEVRILDFGASSSSPTSLTPAYASCELLEGREPDPRDDLFSFACLTYELLAGEHPFQMRRSTEARSLKLAPRRPAGLTGGQWRTLQHGLAWDRINRPASVREWLAAFDLGRAPLGPIPQPEMPKVSPLAKIHPAPLAIAVLAVVILAGVAWAVLSRPKQPALADALVPDVEVAAPPIVEPPPADLPDETAVEEKPAPQAEVKPKPVSRPVDRTERIGMDVPSYSFGARAKFAEIRVHRSSGSKGTTSFEWWTEAASALAGTDFAPQAPATVFFPAGKQTVSVFVKLLPNAARKRTAQFYVVLGNTSSGSALSKVSKASISLAPGKS